MTFIEELDPVVKERLTNPDYYQKNEGEDGFVYNRK